ncbi:MAG: NYN domain-containing protein [Nitrospirota bacterium]
MLKFTEFVDGSNLFGSLRTMNLEVKDYESLFGYIFIEAAKLWNEKTLQTAQVQVELYRTYWYVVGTIDTWDLSLPQSQSALKNSFVKDRELHDYWMKVVGQKNAGVKKLDDLAWADCFNNFKVWYEGKVDTLEKMKTFYQAIRSSTDLIDVIEAGHWKVNFLHKFVEEKGLDTSIAVDLVALEKNYEVAIIITGDADAIPSIKHIKEHGKHVVAVEFINGSPPEEKGRSFSSRLKEHADIVLRIYESDLIKHKIGHRPISKKP